MAWKLEQTVTLSLACDGDKCKRAMAVTKSTKELTHKAATNAGWHVGRGKVALCAQCFRKRQGGVPWPDSGEGTRGNNEQA